MPLYYNGSEVKKMTYNGAEVKVGNYNSIKVFSSGLDWYAKVKSQAVGTDVSIDNYDWIIVNKTTTAATLGLKYWYTNTKFGSDADYKYSILLSVLTTFESTKISTETKNYLNNVTVSSFSGGVTTKVFIPEYDHVSNSYRAFSYYKKDPDRSNANRCFYDTSGNRYDWWTSTASNDTRVYFASDNGTVPSGGRANIDSFGFRPHMEVNLTL